MKAYTVTWAGDAEAALARLYSDNPAVQAEIAWAANEIDRVLVTTPLALGVSIGGNYLQAVVYPLSVLFNMLEADRRVHAIYVKYWTD